MPTDAPRPELVTALLRHGYDFSRVVRQAAAAGPPSVDPAVPVRMLGRRALLLGGPDGVRAFSDTALVRRSGATPGVIADVLFGHGAVHGLDDEDHLQRKQLFVEALDEGASQRLVEEVAGAWAAWTATVGHAHPARVEEEAVVVIGRAVLRWAGLRLPDEEADRVAGWFAAEVDGFASFGPAALRARAARRRSDAWAEDLVVRRRAGVLDVPDDSAVALAARWTGPDGALLPPGVAAVDLQNLLRPAVAVSRFVAFAALDLHRSPRWAQRVRDEHVGGPAHLPMGARGPVASAVAREVRRRAPFVPLLAAVSRREQVLLGRPVGEGERVLLDVVGTLRDPHTWEDPVTFDPERFLLGSPSDPDALVPQGGGSIVSGHRCPGEDPVLGILAGGVTALAVLDPELVGPEPTVDERRIPARPGDGVRIRPRFVRETQPS